MIRPTQPRNDSLVTHLSDTTFATTINDSAQPVVVDLWAPWCGPCRSIAPLLEDLAGKYAGKVRVAKVNVDDYPHLASALGVSGIPTLLAFHQGKLVDRVVGFGGRPPLVALFDRLTALAAAPQAVSA